MTQVSENCVLDVPMDFYHSDCCVGPSLSSGDLVSISKDAAEWYNTHWSNPNASKRDDKQVFRFGRAAHAVVVGGEVFDENYAIRPDNFDSYRTKASKEWRDECIADGVTPLTPDEMKTIDGMAGGIAANPDALSAFEAGLPEQSLFWQQNGIWLKARPDLIPAQDSRIVLDYKTVASVNKWKLKFQINDCGWDQKLANVTTGLIECGMTSATKLEDFDFALVCQAKTAPHETVIVTIEPQDIHSCMRLNAAAIQEFKESYQRVSEKKAFPWRGQNDGFLEYRLEDYALAARSERYGGINGLPTVEIDFN